MRDLKADYLSGHQALREFYEWPLQYSCIPDIIEDRKKFPMDRSLLATVIESQYSGFTAADKVRANTRSLLSDNTFTVTTGHQLCLMGGPMFIIYKIITVINTCTFLKEKFPDFHFVPVLWMASEDHDFEEINHYCPSYDHKVAYPGKFEGAVGRHVIQAEMKGLCPEPFDQTFQAGKLYSKAWMEFFHNIFGGDGLIILDPDNQVLKKSFLPAMEKEITERCTFQQVSASNEKMRKAGYKPGVKPREINLFAFAGKFRVRIEKILDENSGTIGSESGTNDSLIDFARKDPGSISPNVLMRPLYQEAILPNVMYTGGWAEIGYWLQLRESFRAFHISFPMILPRMSATCIRPEQEMEMEKFGLDWNDITTPISDLDRKIAGEFWDEDQFRDLTNQPAGKEKAVQEFLERINPDLTGLASAKRLKNSRHRKDLIRRIIRSLKEKHPKKFNRARALREEIQPEGKVQERILNFTAFPEIGIGELTRLISGHFRPFEFDHQWIILKRRRN